MEKVWCERGPVEVLKNRGANRTRITCKREAHTDIFMWPTRRKTRVGKEVEMFSLEEVELVMSDVEWRLR